MKKIFLILFAFSALTAIAQNRSTVETRALINNYNQTKKGGQMSKRLLDRYPLRQDNESYIIGATAKVDATFDARRAEAMGIKVTSRVADIVAMRMPLDKLALLNELPGIVVFSVAHRAHSTMDKVRFDTRTDSVQAGLGVPMPFNGEGVLVGITDWGFDYTHPNLNRKNNLRIVGVWDHFRTAGPAPEGFDYGTEIRDPQSILDTKCDTFGLYGHATHGTHVAGIIGGLGIGGNAIGQAPKVNYLMGSWFLDEPSWMDQAAWMYRVAKEEGKRLVINNSWGMYNFSTIDGTSLLSQAIDAWTDSGVVIVTSGGNNGDENFHLRHIFKNDDTMRSVAAWYPGGVGESLIFWGEPETADFGWGNFTVFFGLKPYNGDTIYTAPAYATTDNIDYLETELVIATDAANFDTIRYDIMTEEANPLDGRPHVLLNVDKNNKYRLVVYCMADSGTLVNVWNLANTANNAGNMGSDFTNGGIYGALNGDSEYGIGEPACAAKAITVAAHDADHESNVGFYTGGLADFSSTGPALGGGRKPEISAPGVNVVSSYNYYDTADRASYAEVYSDYAFGHRYRWVKMSGTSMSCPAVSGVVALMLQANPYLSVDQIRDIIFSTARNDIRTGDLAANDSISPRWGYGKIDALKCVNAAYDRLLAMGKEPVTTPELVAYPNPTADHVTVLTGSDQPQRAELFAADGRKVLETTVAGQSTVDLSEMPAGIYFLRVHDRYGVRTTKVVKK